MYLHLYMFTGNLVIRCEIVTHILALPELIILQDASFLTHSIIPYKSHRSVYVVLYVNLSPLQPTKLGGVFHPDPSQFTQVSDILIDVSQLVQCTPLTLENVSMSDL